MFKKRYTALLALVLLAAAWIIPADAAEVTVDPTNEFCFSSDDFTLNDTDEGIFLTSVPSSNIADLHYGERVLKAGDALTLDDLDALTLKTSCVTEQTASVEYCTVADGKVTGIKSLKMSIRPQKNKPPTAEDSDFETYKNIPNKGTLKASDPENKPLTFTLTEEPKRGTVELHEDGTFTYTPNKNKVGSDSFTFTATDDGGNVSEPAKVFIKIIKPTDRATYADMANDPDQFTAMWMKDQGIFTGPTIGGHLCFSPDETVSRGEFLVMVMKLVQADKDLSTMTSGFADEQQSPTWMQPYIATALSNGMITGSDQNGNVVFRPAEAMSKAEAAVMLQNILQLPKADTTTVFAAQESEVIPAWAATAVSTLSNAGVPMEISSENEILTRRAAGRILHDVSILLQENMVETFHWVK